MPMPSRDFPRVDLTTVNENDDSFRTAGFEPNYPPPLIMKSPKGEADDPRLGPAGDVTHHQRIPHYVPFGITMPRAYGLRPQ